MDANMKTPPVAVAVALGVSIDGKINGKPVITPVPGINAISWRLWATEYSRAACLRVVLVLLQTGGPEIGV